MSAKQPTQAPDFDATAFTNQLQKGPITAAVAKQLVKWKRWSEASAEYDGVGLRDVVAANATFLNAVKLNVDQNSIVIDSLTDRVTALENRPTVPFPASGPRTGGV